MIRLSAVFVPRTVLAALLIAAGAASAQAPEPTPLPLADRALAAADGSRLTLGDAAGPEGLVVLFWSTTCPWADRYAPRVADLVASYAPAGVGFVLVTSDGPQAREAPAGTARGGGAARARPGANASRRQPAAGGLTVPYVADAGGALAAALGVRSAPHAFFFGPDQTLVYDGAVDDSPADVGRVQIPYLRQAMDQSIAGLPVEVMKTQAFGCTVQGRP